MGHNHLNNGPLPHIQAEARKSDERDALGTDSKRRKFSAREMLSRISQHKAGEKVTLRDGDENFHEILENSGLVDISNGEEVTTATRTNLDIPEPTLESLTFSMEKQILEIRKKLEDAKPERQSDR